MEYLNFFAESTAHFFGGLVVLIILSLVLCFIVSQPFGIMRVAIRGRNIAKHGWPPEHCNADGSLRPEPAQEDD
ncbi:MAG: hypothetical protein EOO77_21295 [Oxalobacteraceae bacterium]|nr:MAG: hypothetical protein EOO77_21295 [Oxalobacteraceae bacterium]